MKKELELATVRLEPLDKIHKRETETLGIKDGRKYEVTNTLAEDAFATTREVTDLVVNRSVVMKVMAGTAAAPDHVSGRLIREARILGKLQHPGIPPLYEAGLDEKGNPFYTMRSPGGVSLRQILDEMKAGKTRTLIHYTVRRTLSIFQKVCDAVAYAHSQEVLHRNLGAEHIIVGEYGEVFVTGWESMLNIEHFSEGRMQEMNFYPDIAALGKILYEIITLNSPSSRNGMEKCPSFIVPPKPDSARSKAFETLLAASKRAMARQSHNSYHSVKEFLRDIDTFKDSADDPSETLSLRTILLHLAKGYKWVIAVPAALLVLVILLTWLLIAKIGAHPQPAATPAAPVQVQPDVSSDRKLLESLKSDPAKK
jgi:hypothetical protein